MIYKTIELRDFYPALKDSAPLTIFAHENSPEYCDKNRKRKTILLLPGGSYFFRSDREADVVALRFMSYGYNVALLHYNLRPYPVDGYPFLEGYAAIAYLREKQKKYHVDPEGIFALGFSAGGHFAATLGAYMEDPFFYETLGIKKEAIKVNGLLLSYPVISLSGPEKEWMALEMFGNDKKRLEKYSIERHVGPNYPRTFLWATRNDELLGAKDVLLMSEALERAGVSFELHIYPDGEHGASLAEPWLWKEGVEEGRVEKILYLQDWIKQALRFLSMKEAPKKAR